jgi:hypothetical protein
MTCSSPVSEPESVSVPPGEHPPHGPTPTPVPCKGCGSTEPADERGLCRGVPGNKCRWLRVGSQLALKHGGRRSLDRPEALAAIAGKRAELVEHMGGDPSLLEADLLTDYARVDVLIESVAANIEVGGIFTPKGSARAAVSLLLSLLDRRLRLATTLGIQRKAKPVASLSEVLNGSK